MTHIDTQINNHRHRTSEHTCSPLWNKRLAKVQRTSTALIFLTIILTLVACKKDNGETAQNDSFLRFYGNSFIDEGQYITQVDDKSYLMIANFTDENQLQGGKILKLNEYGALLWEYRSIDTLNLSIKKLLVTSDNSIVWVGNGVNPITKNIDVVIAKINAEGQLQWKKYAGGAENQYGNTICQTADEGFLVGGSTDITGNKDLYLHKFNADGDSLWARRYGTGTEDEVNDICNSHNDGFIVTGKYGFTAAGQTGTNMAAIEINQAGNLIDAYTYEESGDDEGNEVKLTADGYIFTGTTQNAQNGETDILVIKTTTSIREIQWQKTFGGTAEETGRSVFINSNGTFTIAGATESFGYGNSDAYVLNISSEGNLLLEKTFGSNADEWINSVIQTSDGGFACVGATEFTENRMIVFIKLTPDYEQQ